MAKRKRILALLLAAVLLAGCSFLDTTALQDKMRLSSAVAYEDMEYTRPDMAEIERALQKVCDTAENSKSITEVVDAINEYGSIYDAFYTNHALAYIQYCLDVTDTQWAQEYAFCAEKLATVEAGLEQMNRTLAASSHRTALEKPEYFGKDYFAAYESGEAMWTETLVELMEQEAALESRYLELCAEATEKNLNAWQTLSTYGDSLMEVYLDLVSTRNSMASEAGYDSYLDFAYENLYGREYTPQQAMAYLSQVGQQMQGVYGKIDFDRILDAADGLCAESKTWEYVQTAAESMGGRPLAAFRYLEKTGTYDITHSANKYDASFQTYLYSYESSFIFLNPALQQTDKLAFAHEFGHYAGAYAAFGNYMGLDVAEVQSQAMEYLSLSYAGANQALTNYKLAESASVYVEQSLIAAFEHRVYQLEQKKLTKASVSGLFRQACEEYGLADTGTYGNVFLLIQHLVTEPLYVISYVVSNDVAMQIYQLELQDPGAGLKVYNKCLTRADMYLTDLVQACGLKDPLSEERLQQAKTFLEEALIK